MRFGTRMTMAVWAAVLAALLLGAGFSSTAMAPQAIACEKHDKKDKKDCRDGSSPGTPTPPTSPIGTVRITGTLTREINPQTLATQRVTVDGTLTNGLASGQASATTPTPPAEFSGPVQEITIPGTGRDYYCVNFLAAGISPTSIYIQDIGDGITSGDAFTIEGGPGVTCATPPGAFSPSTSGDIVVTQS